jgi:ABC-2 type transport system ATP-binding protein
VVESIAIDDLMLVELPEGVPTRAVWLAALEAGCQIRLLKPRRSTLEEVFLRAIAEAV